LLQEKPLSFGIAIALYTITIAAILVGYINVLDAYFVSDDLTHIASLHGSAGELLWHKAATHWVSGQHFSSFRPMVTLYELFMLQLVGVDPAGLRIGNLVLQFSNACLLGLLAGRLTGRAWIGGLASLLFVATPIHSEAVTWFAGNPALLFVLFTLIAAHCALFWHEKSAPVWLVLLAVAGAAALGAKEEAVSLPAYVGIAVFARALRERPTVHGGVLAVRAALVPVAVSLAVLIVYLLWRHYVIEVSNRPLGGYTDALGGLFRAAYRGLVGFLTPSSPLTDLPDRRLWETLITLGIGGAIAVGLFARPISFILVIVLAALAYFSSLVPTNQIVAGGWGPGLALTRFYYAGSAAIAVVLAAGIGFGIENSKTGVVRAGLRALSGSAALLLVFVGLYLLHANNIPWRIAGDTMYYLQRQAMEMTYSDPQSPVINVPDMIRGVYFDRGGWQYARSSPFVAGQFGHRQWRKVELRNSGSEPVELRFDNSTGADFSATPTIELAKGASTLMQVTFDPSRPGNQVATVHASAVCGSRGRVEADVAIFDGRGHDIGLRDTPLLHSVAGVSKMRDGLYVVHVGVADLGDGIPATNLKVFADDVEMSLVGPRPPDDTLEDGKMVFLNILLDSSRQPFIPSTKSKKPAPGNAWLPITVWADNGFPTPLAFDDEMNFLEVPAAVAARMAANRPVSSPDGSPVLVEPCATAVPEPKRISFGWMPVAAQASPTGEAAAARPGNVRPALFFDEVSGRLVSTKELDAAAVEYLVTPDELANWETYDQTKVMLFSGYSLVAARHDAFVGMTSPPVDLDPRKVDYAIVEMRSIFAKAPYALVAFSDTSEGFNEIGVTTIPTLPDGRWRSVVLPLYQNQAWRTADRIRRLRFTFDMGGAHVEIRSIKLIGRVP